LELLYHKNEFGPEPACIDLIWCEVDCLSRVYEVAARVGNDVDASNENRVTGLDCQTDHQSERRRALYTTASTYHSKNHQVIISLILLD
jgi:hypothetical protein